MALPQALGTDLPPIPSGIAGDVQRKVRAGAEAEAGMAEAVAAKTKELTAPIQAAKEQEVGTQQAKITSAGEQLAKPLEVPKETVQDMAALGGLAAVVGAMLGSSGKMSAQNVLGSMTGILDGYKKGNNDLITKYQKEFDMNQKRLQSQIQQAQTELSVILEKYKVRDQTVAQDIAAFSAKYAGSIAGTIADAKSAGEVARLNVQLAQMGQSASQHADNLLATSMRNAYIDPATGKKYYVDPKTKQLTEMAGTEGLVSQQEYLQDLREKSADRRRELDRQLKLDLAAQKSEGAGALPKDEKTRSAHASRYQVAKQAEEILSLLNDPNYSKLITPTTAITPEVVLNLKQNFPELATKLARIQRIEFEIGGKNLTGSEQKILEPIYGWRKIDANTLRTRLRETINDMQTSNALVEEYFPGLKAMHDKYDRVYEQRGRVDPVQSMPGSGNQDVEQSARQKFGNYEPDKYNYGFDDKGFYREPK